MSGTLREDWGRDSTGVSRGSSATKRVIVVAEDPWVRAGLAHGVTGAIGRDDVEVTAATPRGLSRAEGDVALVWPRSVQGPDWYAASSALRVLRERAPGTCRVAVTDRTTSTVRTLRLVEEGAQYLVPDDDLKELTPDSRRVAQSIVDGDIDEEYAAPDSRALRVRLGLRKGNLPQFLEVAASVPSTVWTYAGPLAHSGLTRRAQEHLRRAALEIGGVPAPELAGAGPRPSPTMPRFATVAALVRDAWGLD